MSPLSNDTRRLTTGSAGKPASLAEILNNLAAARVWTLVERWFFIPYLIAGWLFVVVTPPFQVPDEASHYYRAYQLSRGGWWPERHGGVLGGWLPSEVVAAVSTRGMPFHPDRRVRPSTLAEDIRAQLSQPSSGEEIFAGFPNVMLYPAWVYLPHATGIFLARQVTPSPTLQLYAGRLFGFSLLACLVLLGIRLARPHHHFLWLSAWTPMTLFQLAGISADGLTLACAFVCGGLLWRWAHGPGHSFPPKEWLLFLLVSALLATSKTVYCLLPLAVMGLPGFPKVHSAGSPHIGRVARVVLLTMLTLVLTMAWLWVARQWFAAPQRPHMTIAPADQMVFVLQQPFHFLKIFYIQVHHNLYRFFMAFVGNLGWQDTPMPTWFYLLWLGFFAAIGMLSPARPFQGRLVFCLTLVLAITFIGIFLVMYLGFTPPGANHIDGVQGRYFLPLLPFACLLPPMLKPPLHKYRGRFFRKISCRASMGSPTLVLAPLLIAFSLISTVTALCSLTLRFYD